jgi:hypothetical protein
MTIASPTPGDYAAPFQRYLDDVARFSDALDAYEAQETALVAMAGWDEARAGHRYAAGKWSVREVVGHMADFERIGAYRLLRIARGDATPLAGFDENAYQQHARFEARTLASVVDELRAVRDATLPLVRWLDAAALDRIGTANDHRTSARALVWVIAGHFQHHADILRDRYGM